MRRALALLAASCIASTSAIAQVAVLAPGGYFENFDSIGVTGTAVPLGWSVWSLPGGNTTFSASIPESAVSGGTQNTPPGSLGVFTQSGTGTTANNNNGYNFGFIADPGNRMLGTAPTSFAASVLQLEIENQTGAVLTSLSISYAMRVMSAPAGNELPGYRAFVGTGGVGGAFVSVPILDAVAAPTDAAGTSIARGGVIALPSEIPPGGTIVLRFVDDNASQSSPDQEFAIDDVRVLVGSAVVGACCPGDGTCRFAADASSCAGVFQGAGTLCLPNPCPEPTGACCSAGGSCVVSVQGDCAAGRWARGVSCLPSLCAQPGDTRFAVIGDYGVDNANQAAVAAMVHAFGPEFITTVGDNTYFTNADVTNWDRTQAKYYRAFIKLPPNSAYLGQGAAVNNFFPVLGNHDLDVGASSASFTSYFDLPGNERYYTFTRGPVDFFMLSSDPREPDSPNVGGAQHAWLLSQLPLSTRPWKLVFFHHPAYTSQGAHAPATWMQAWNFQSLGLTAVLAGHNHFLERIERFGMPWFVVGSGGQSLYAITTQDPASAFRNNTEFGFQIVDASESRITFRMVNAAGAVLDTRVIETQGVCCRGATCAVTAISACVSPGPGLGARFVPASASCAGTWAQPCCRADFNQGGDGGVGVQDLFDFLRVWFTGDALADINGVDGATVQDIFDFLAAWFTGC